MGSEKPQMGSLKSHPAAQRRATPVYFPTDAHWSALGHWVVARALAESWAWPD